MIKKKNKNKYNLSKMTVGFECRTRCLHGPQPARIAATSRIQLKTRSHVNNTFHKNGMRSTTTTQNCIYMCGFIVEQQRWSIQRFHRCKTFQSLTHTHKNTCVRLSISFSVSFVSSRFSFFFCAFSFLLYSLLFTVHTCEPRSTHTCKHAHGCRIKTIQ